MRRSVIVGAVLLLIQILAVTAMAQDKLAGNWVGKVKSPRGERDANATFKKDGDKYTGTISGLMPGQQVPLKDIKVDGDDVTAVADMETPQATITINYKFKLQGDALNGQGSLDFNGNQVNFDVELKRDSGNTTVGNSAGSGAAAGDKLAGKWAGKMKSIQGERDANATFKKEDSGYAGTISGMRPGQEIPLKNIKLEGDKLTAVAEIETPQATIVINYDFTLKGSEMNGKGSLDFNGTPFSFDVELKRDSGAASSATQPQPATARQQRAQSDQPQQKQSIDYFAGKWSFKFIGRESAIGPAPREGFVTFTKRADGKSADGIVEGIADGKPFKESMTLVFDETGKTLTLTEKSANGVQLNGAGDWSSPIAIRFMINPVKVAGQSLQIRRTISVVSAHSFTITDELSEDGGPFVRLGNAIYSKAQ